MRAKAVTYVRQCRDHVRQGRDHGRQGPDHERQSRNRATMRDHVHEHLRENSDHCAKTATMRANAATMCARPRPCAPR